VIEFSASSKSLGSNYSWSIYKIFFWQEKGRVLFVVPIQSEKKL